MKFRPEDFDRNAKTAALDAEVRKVFTRATAKLVEERTEAFAAMGGIESTRNAGRAIRQKGLDDLHGCIARLEDKIGQLGGTVHHAMTAADAVGIVAGILDRRGITQVVKSKSMTSEEIGLNEGLRQRGVEAVETDLGEFIVQLARSTPSHIVGPALHMTRTAVADLFRERLNRSVDDDPARLASVAREVLRGRLLKARAGITGVNFAAADTGTLVIVENEGNARMVASLPPVHIAIMGIEKVVPSLEEIPILLRLLVRSATGQKMPSYVSFISGLGKTPEKTRPTRELHLVLLDNGRSRILAEPALREALMCIRCGACLNTCPVYATIGGHPYGFAYQGPIGAVLAPMLLGPAKAASLPFASSLCGACREACPMGIDLPSMLIDLRARIAEGFSRKRFSFSASVESRLMRLAPGMLDGSPVSRKRQVWASRLIGLLSRHGRARRLPFPLSRWTRFKDFPEPPRESFSAWWRNRGPDEQ